MRALFFWLSLGATALGCRDWGRFELTQAAGGEAGAGANPAGGAPSGGGPSGGGPTGGTASGAGGEGGAPPAAVCGVIDVVADDFEGAALEWWWTKSVNAPQGVGLADGKLELRLQDPGAYSEIYSVGQFDFRDRWIEFQLAEDVPAGTGIWFTVGSNYDDYVELYVRNGDLVWYLEDGGVVDQDTFIPFDFADHRRLRIRHDSNASSDQRVLGEAWIDGQWTVLFTHDDSIFDPRYARVFAGAHVLDAAATPATLRVEAISALQSDTPLCKLEELKDDFETAEVPWVDEVGATSCDLLQSGSVQVECASSNGFSALRSKEIFDAIDSGATIDLLGPLPAAGYASLHFAEPTNQDPLTRDLVYARVSPTDIRLEQRVSLGFSTLDSAAVTGLVSRIGLRGTSTGEVILEYVEDGEEKSLRPAEAPFDLSHVHGRFGAGVGALPGGESASIELDDYNLGAPP
jgi:hypothetical protein